MKTKQVNVWIPEDLRDYLARRAEDEKYPMNAIIADLIRDDMVKRNDHLIEQTLLLKLQEMVIEIVRAEVRKAHVQLRCELREDRQSEAKTFFVRLQNTLDRLVSLLVIVVRSSGIARRLIYTSLAKNYGAQFARTVYDDAREKVSQELSLKQVAPESLRQKLPAS